MSAVDIAALGSVTLGALVDAHDALALPTATAAFVAADDTRAAAIDTPVPPSQASGSARATTGAPSGAVVRSSAFARLPSASDTPRAAAGVTTLLFAASTDVAPTATLVSVDKIMEETEAGKEPIGVVGVAPPGGDDKSSSVFTDASTFVVDALEGLADRPTIDCSEFAMFRTVESSIITMVTAEPLASVDAAAKMPLNKLANEPSASKRPVEIASAARTLTEAVERESERVDEDPPAAVDADASDVALPRRPTDGYGFARSPALSETIPDDSVAASVPALDAGVTYSATAT